MKTSCCIGFRVRRVEYKVPYLQRSRLTFVATKADEASPTWVIGLHFGIPYETHISYMCILNKTL